MKKSELVNLIKESLTEVLADYDLTPKTSAEWSAKKDAEQETKPDDFEYSSDEFNPKKLSAARAGFNKASAARGIDASELPDDTGIVEVIKTMVKEELAKIQTKK